MPAACSLRETNMCQKIRTIELDGKTVKLQIVRTHGHVARVACS
jgi:hypothetical protein